MISLRPWRCVASVDLISVEALVRGGVRCVLIDRDNTCVPRDDTVAPPEILAWLDSVREAGIATVLVSNNTHRSEVERSARELGCDLVAPAFKPVPFALEHAMRAQGVKPHETVMVGDQVFTDVVAGNLAGIRTVLVRPQSPKDLWYTLIIRKVDKALYGERTYEGE